MAFHNSSAVTSTITIVVGTATVIGQQLFYNQLGHGDAL